MGSRRACGEWEVGKDGSGHWKKRQPEDEKGVGTGRKGGKW